MRGADLSRVLDRGLPLPVRRGLAVSIDFSLDGLTRNGSAIAAARNRSGDGVGGVAQGVGANQPAAVPFARGARIAARFDGSNDVLDGVALTTAIPVPFDFLTVARITTNRDFGRVFGLAGSNSMGLDCNAAGSIYLFNGSIAAFATNDSQWHVYYGRFAGASSQASVDRGALVALNPGTAVSSLTGVSVGGALSGSVRLAGDVGEVHVFNRTLAEWERRACVDALMSRWGLR